MKKLKIFIGNQLCFCLLLMFIWATRFQSSCFITHFLPSKQTTWRIWVTTKCEMTEIRWELVISQFILRKHLRYLDIAHKHFLRGVRKRVSHLMKQCFFTWLGLNSFSRCVTLTWHMLTYEMGRRRLFFKKNVGACFGSYDNNITKHYI